MNTINEENITKKTYTEFSITDLCMKCNTPHTACIGKIGDRYGLFLITYSALVFASEPDMIYECGIIEVERFVDIEITIKE